MFTRTTRAKRNIATVALAALVGSLLALSSPAGADTNTLAADSERISGANRYATAAAIATDTRWDDMGVTSGGTGVDIVVVNGENYPDGLAAAAYGRRVLLTRTDSVPTETADALTTLAAATIDIDSVTVVGGTGVVSSAVLEELGTLAGVASVTRISGADRYATALAVAKDIDTSPNNIVLATGTNFPDALAAGPLALDLSVDATNQTPIVLTSGSSLSADVSAYIAAMTPGGTVYIIGGTGVIPASIETEITALGQNFERLSGDTREATAVAVAEKIADNAEESALLVNRDGFADALAAGPFAHQLDINGALMLVNADSIPSATADWHVANCSTLGAETAAAAPPAPAINGEVFAIGGSAVVSDTVLAGAAAATACTVPAIASATYVSDTATSRVIAPDFAGFTAGTFKFTATSTGAAAGLAGNNWDIEFATAVAVPPATVAVDSAETVLNVTNPRLKIYLAGDTSTLTQQTLADRINAIPHAAALFTASYTDASETLTHTNGNDVYTNIAGYTTSVASTVKHTVTVTMNVPVGAAGDFDATPAVTVFAETQSDGTTPADFADGFTAAISPLGGIVDADGGTVFTITITGSDAAVATGDQITIAANQLSTKGDVNIASVMTKTLVAG